MYHLQNLILEEASKNITVRMAVLNSNNLPMIEDFIGQRMPLGINFNFSVCNPSGYCNVEVPDSVKEREVYVTDMLMSATLNQYNPKRLKIISWIGGGEVTRKGSTSVGTVIIYCFNEGSGNLVSDSSGNSYTGDIIDSPQWVAGKSGTALQFDGVNDYVNITTISEIRNAITIEAWIKPDNLAEDDAIIMKPHISDATPKSMYFLGIGKSNALRFSIATNNNRYFVDSAANSLQAGVWQHVAGVYDGLQMKVYVNGVPGNPTPITGTIDTNLMPVWIARGKVNGATNQFKGTIDHVRIYSRALNSSEISQHMSNPTC
jgi:hypothetical protein